MLGISRGASDAVVAVVRGASGGDCATSGDNIAGASFGERFCQDPVDVVYTWVNGSDPVWLRQMRHFRSLESAAAAGATDAGAGTDAGGATAGNATSGEDGEPRPPAERDGGDTAGANRYRDNEELRYSLRSLFKYAPWVRNVILVTNGQVPLWLNTDHPRIRVVTHEEIFPDPSQLPVFSSPAIEVHLHRIPGLSRRFIYFNDDVLLGADVWPDDFWSHAAGHMVYFSWEVPKCNAGCIDSWIGDGFCDRACNTSRCMWDDGDCSGPNIKPGAGMSAAGLGAAGGTSFATHSGYGGSTVHYCAEGCPANWPGDKTCDSRCNVASCGFDAADCTLDDVYRGVPGAEPVAARGGARLGSTAEAAASSAAPAAAAHAPAAAAAEGPVAEGAAALGGQAGAVAAAEAATLAALDAAAAAAEEALDAERRSCRRAVNSSDAEEQCEALATGRVPSPAGPMSDARFGVDVSPAELVLRGKDAAWYVNVSSLALGAARAVMARMGCVGETVGSTRGAMQGSPDGMPATLSNATRCRPRSVQEADIEWTLAEYPPEAGGWLPTVVLAPHAGMLVALADPVADQSADEALALSGAAVESGAGAAAAGGTTSLSKLPTARMAWAAGNACGGNRTAAAPAAAAPAAATDASAAAAAGAKPSSPALPLAAALGGNGTLSDAAQQQRCLAEPEVGSLVRVASVEFLLEAAVAGWTVRFRIPARVSREVAEPAPTPTPTPAPTASPSPAASAASEVPGATATTLPSPSPVAALSAEPLSADGSPRSRAAAEEASNPEGGASTAPPAASAGRPSRARSLSAAAGVAPPSPSPRAARIAGRTEPGGERRREGRRLADRAGRASDPARLPGGAGAAWREAFVAVAQAMKEDDAPMAPPRPSDDLDWAADPVGAAAAWIAGAGEELLSQQAARPAGPASRGGDGGGKALEQLLASAWRSAVRATPGADSGGGASGGDAGAATGASAAGEPRGASPAGGTRPGRSAVRGRRLDTYGDSLVKTNTIISSAVGRRNRKVPAHMPHMIDREEMEKLQNWEPMREAWQQTSSRRFRSPEDVQYAFAFFYWVMEAAAASGGTQRAALERFWARELDSNGDGVIDTNEFRTLAAIVKGGGVSDFDVMEVLSCVAPSGNANRHTVQLPNGAVVETVSVETPAVTLDGVLKCSRTAEALKRKVKERAPPTHTIASEAEVAFEMIGDDFNRTQEQLDSVRARRAKFICINDDMDVAPPALQQVLRDFFDSYFPEQCAMELEYGWENRYQYIGPMRRLKVVQLVLRVVGWGALLVAVAGVVASYLTSRVGAAKRGDDDEDGRDEGAAPAAGPPALRQRVRHEE